MIEVLEVDIVQFFIRLQENLPFVPLTRCQGAIYWFSSQRISEEVSFDEIQRKLSMGDGRMYAEATYLLGEENLSRALRQSFNNYLMQLAQLNAASMELNSSMQRV